MTNAVRGLAIGVTLLLLTAPALAQSTAAQEQTPAPPPAEVQTRPATTTSFGDTGIWFVPTGEILPHGKWSASAYYVNFDREEGYSDITNYAGTFAFGVKDRVEIFGTVIVDTRIRRALNPVFRAGAGGAQGLLNDYPEVTERWIHDNFGDIRVGVKFNALSEADQKPLALAFRFAVQLPSASRDAGAGTGRPTTYIDAIASKEFAEKVEMAFSGGVALRSSPPNIKLSNTARFGYGLSFPSRSKFRVFGEATYEAKFNKTIDLSAPLVAPDGSEAPTQSYIREPFDLTGGIVFQAENGFFVSAGVLYAVNQRGRGRFGNTSVSGDNIGGEVRLGYHPGVRIYVPPPPPAPPPPPPPANQAPTVRVECSPCTVNVGETSTVTADARDPDGDTLTFKWSAPAGSFADPAASQTAWTAPAEEGPVPVTVTVSDGKGGTASDSVTIQVVRPPKKEIVFEDVHFDFDRYTLRPAATRLLDEVVQAMREDETLRIEIEGHTCNIGTAEYNLALGERRANAVRDYLTSNGISVDRLRTVSYGEERPKYDNSREETRRLNRRAALVVRLQ